MMTEQTINPPVRPALSEIDFNYGQIRRDMFVRRVGKVLFYLNPIVSYFFLWAPIVVLVVLSFNKSKTVSVWGGFTTDWYVEIFNGTSQFTGDMGKALYNTLFIAVISTFISTIIGTMVSIALERGFFPGKKIVDAVLYLPVVIPEITQAVSLAIFFKFLFDTMQFITRVHIRQASANSNDHEGHRKHHMSDNDRSEAKCRLPTADKLNGIK